MGLDSKSTWHTESKGVMFIDNYFRKIGKGSEKDNAEENIN